MEPWVTTCNYCFACILLLASLLGVAAIFYRCHPLPRAVIAQTSHLRLVVGPGADVVGPASFSGPASGCRLLFLAIF